MSLKMWWALSKKQLPILFIHEHKWGIEELKEENTETEVCIKGPTRAKAGV